MRYGRRREEGRVLFHTHCVSVHFFPHIILKNKEIQLAEAVMLVLLSASPQNK